MPPAKHVVDDAVCMQKCQHSFEDGRFLHVAAPLRSEKKEKMNNYLLCSNALDCVESLAAPESVD